MTVLTYPCYYPELCKLSSIKKPCHICRLYAQGRLEPEYPVPAHRYTVQFNTYSVEMVIGITKQWYPRFPEPFVGPYIDCELVAMWTNYPKDLFS